MCIRMWITENSNCSLTFKLGKKKNLNNRSLDKSALLKLNFLIYQSKHMLWDGSFEHPKQMFKLIDKNIFSFTLNFFLPIWTYKYPLSVLALPSELSLPPESLSSLPPVERQY